MNEKLIKKLVDNFGKEKVIKSFELLGLIKSKGDVTTLDDPTPGDDGSGNTCETGYYWSETLKKCVLDIGPQ